MQTIRTAVRGILSFVGQSLVTGAQLVVFLAIAAMCLPGGSALKAQLDGGTRAGIATVLDPTGRVESAGADRAEVLITTTYGRQIIVRGDVRAIDVSHESR